jgi:hypothetical protein
MAAEQGNKYAETITKEVALELAQKALAAINDNCYFLSEVAEKCETYRTKFNYVLEKFKEDEEVFDAIKRMYNKCEAIVVKKTAKGDIVPSLGIFILKAYHDLIETSKLNQEVTGKDGKDLFRNLSEEDINERIQKLLNK